jgi:hypothetical protein
MQRPSSTCTRFDHWKGSLSVNRGHLFPFISANYDVYFTVSHISAAVTELHDSTMLSAQATTTSAMASIGA